MNDKSRLRIKALREQNFEHWISRIKISSQRETHFIGMGGGGTNAVKFLWSNWVRGRYTVVNTHENKDIPDGINLIPFHSPKNIKFTGKKEDIYVPDLENPLKLQEKLTWLNREDCRLVLLAGLGGYTGTKMAEALSGMLHKQQKDFLTICSMPFRFEGRSRLANAQEAMNRMKTIPNCHFFELEMLRDEYENMSLSEAFPAADRYFYRIISKLRIV